jgi:putative two-component system response regulator
MFVQTSAPPPVQSIPPIDLDQAALHLSRIRQAIASLDRTTREHSERLASAARSFGDFLGLSSTDLHTLTWGAYLHDIGKVAIPTNVLHKPGQLTEEEWVIMRQHVLIGEFMCAAQFPMPKIIPIIRHHHEHWDGSGYPDRQVGEEIPYLARVVQILDVYDALTHLREYKPTYNHRQAMDIIAEETAQGWYQTELVEQFFQFTESA